MIPSADTIQRIPGVDGFIALKIRRVLDGRLDPCVASGACARWVRQCYSTPTLVSRKLCAVNELLDTYGVETIWASETKPLYSYCNAGDTYALTLVYSHQTCRWLVTSYGDLVERAERRGEVSHD